MQNAVSRHNPIGCDTAAWGLPSVGASTGRACLVTECTDGINRACWIPWPARGLVIVVCASQTFVICAFHLFSPLAETCVPRELYAFNPFTASLSQPVQNLGWTVHAQVCKRYIFRSYNWSTFNTVLVLVEILLHTSWVCVWGGGGMKKGLRI